MSPTKPKRNPDQLRTFVKDRAAKDNAHLSAAPGTMTPARSSRGSMISGTDLLRAKPAIDLIPDKAIRRQVNSMFATFTKYQALQLILDGNFMTAHREIAEQIADKATEVDYISDPPAVFGGRRTF